MSPAVFENVTRLGGWVDLTGRTKLEVIGPDRLRYLNGQLTNDVRKLKPNETLYACVTNAKGRIQADVFVHGDGSKDGSFLLDAEPGLRESLTMRLERYLVADDVEIRDVTDQWSLFHLFGPAAEALPPLPAGSQAVQANRLGIPGVDLWWLADSPAVALPGTPLSQGDAEVLRIVQGIPRWPEELNEDYFPQEAGLESKAIDFFKGCYIGQEVLSRIKSTGKMPKTLVKFQASVAVSSSVEPDGWRGMSLWIRGEDGTVKEAGTITSAGLHPLLDRWIGLAYVRQSVPSLHSQLLAGREGHRLLGEIEITAS